jgi:capsular polysaccharide biosynthesis protein
MWQDVRWAVAISLLAAFVVTWHGLSQVPRYEATAKVWVDVRSTECSRGICLIPNAPSASLTRLATQEVRIDSPSVAKEAIRRVGLEMSPDELLHGLRVQRVEPIIQLSYTDTDPKRAQEVVGPVGRIAAERITGTSTGELPLDTELTAAVWDVRAPHEPVSPKPLRDGLITLAMGLTLSTIPIAVREYLRGNYQRFL